MPANDLQVIAEYEKQTAVIHKQSTDLVSQPVVLNGYIKKGLPNTLAFTNLAQMSIARLKKQFPYAQMEDPLMKRIRAELQKICAECIVIKYQKREQGIYNYDHGKDADNRCKLWLIQNLNRTQKEYAELMKLPINQTPVKDIDKIGHVKEGDLLND